MKGWIVVVALMAGSWSPGAHLAAQVSPTGAFPSVVSLETADGVSIPGRVYRSEGTVGRPFVLLFHQGGASGEAEYAPIAPRVHALGLNVLVIDQRRGGDLFGGANRVAPNFDEEATSYCDALPDLEAALAYARTTEPEQPAVLWGSSYSAALVIQLAAERPSDVAGVLAFSPASGDPMDGCRPEPFAARLTVPLLALRPASEMEHEWIAGQLEAFASMGHETWVADPGRHGSSMLVADRVGDDTAATWTVVEAFLRRVAGSP